MAGIALGTVQFGLDYGINNPDGKTSADEVKKILSCAYSGGVGILDTAAAYGNSEEVLGESLAGTDMDFRLVSKLMPGSTGADVAAGFHSSLQKLGRKSLYGYLIHHYANLKADPSIWPEMQKLKGQGLVERIGISLYHPDEARFLWDHDMNFELVQVPFNIFDQRFNSVFGEMKGRGVEIHVRSAFLQGLFFRKPDQLPRHFLPVSGKIAKLHALAETSGLGIADLCLGFGLINPHIDQVVIGVDRVGNLEENLKVLEKLDRIAEFSADLTVLEEPSEQIILPVNWELD